MRSAIIVVVSVILLGILGPALLFTVDETQFVLITRFGDVRRVMTSPGLKAKVPFIDTVVKLDKRLLRVDVPVASMPDVDNQFLDIDAYTRYRIVDPRKFREKLVTEINAASRISQIVIGELRAEIGRKTQSEIIGGLREVGEQGLAVTDEEGRVVVVAGVTEEGVPTREDITRAVRNRADARVKSPENDFGIEIVDVKVKRADFPGAIEENVFQRMRTERSVQAQRLRAQGEEEFLSRTADVNRRVEIISAEADETSNQLRGEGVGEAIRILAEALERDPELFGFLRSLEAYRVFLNEQTTLVLSPDSDLFQYLQSPRPPAGSRATPEPTPTPAP